MWWGDAGINLVDLILRQDIFQPSQPIISGGGQFELGRPAGDFPAPFVPMGARRTGFAVICRDTVCAGKALAFEKPQGKRFIDRQALGQRQQTLTDMDPTLKAALAKIRR